MKILVINSGSSSIKYKLYAVGEPEPLASGQIERIGQQTSHLSHKAQGRAPVEQDARVADHKEGLAAIMDLLCCSESGALRHPEEIVGVGHRVVHGGERFSAPALVDAAVLEDIRAAIPLAPLHNPANLAGIEAAAELFPEAAQVAVFDTAFHQTMPAHSYIYALPYELYEKYGVRRYGFHGISHQFVSREAARFLGRTVEQTNLITLHLGGGGSVCAILRGKSIDTSMGMTPLSGTIMGTRCGDIDPEIQVFLERQGYSLDEVDEILNKKSGLLGVAGASDMRDVHAKRAAGELRAQLAFEMYCHVLRKYIGGYYTELGGAHALVFTGGVGEHDAAMRWETCRGLGRLGFVIDAAANDSPSLETRFISSEQSPHPVLVVPTNEEYEIARQTQVLLEANKG